MAKQHTHIYRYLQAVNKPEIGSSVGMRTATVARNNRGYTIIYKIGSQWVFGFIILNMGVYINKSGCNYLPCGIYFGFGVPGFRLPIAAILLPRKAISARYQGFPLPSTTLALRISISALSSCAIPPLANPIRIKKKFKTLRQVFFELPSHTTMLLKKCSFYLIVTKVILYQ